MTSEKGSRKDKNQNIQVFVRLRPLNQRERDIKSLGVVEVANGREVVVRQSQQTAHTKKFTFDRAFPPHSKQVEIYQEVVSPLIEEVLAGYNCTVFAYGQTGTGKTHTMVGEAAADESTWQTDPLAGIIPRALSQLFDELRISNTEYTVRVSYLELYNEELFDLLSTSEDNSKLRIYEDVTRKGSNIVNGLEEITVYNKNEVYRIMAQGQERKRVASTLMNSQSSRSHTVFTIVVHMKENSSEGEELVKIGKLNLVDLAGSENISKAGSDNPAKRERARECVNINQSLLTLGRVITALVERHPHIPYRESKLTRILQESLGGRTKTSIIATISPGHKDLEETMSTLEYANRAKNIQNKPEINQKMTKKAILKEFAEEIDRLKRDLYAAREKNGVYLANETFTEMTLKQEEQRKEIQELLLKKRAMEEERDRMETIFKELNCQLMEHKDKLTKTALKLSNTQTVLAHTNDMLNSTKLHCEEQKHLLSKRAETETLLSSQAKQLLAVADAASTDVNRLHDSVDKRRSVESKNLEATRRYREVSAQHHHNIVTGTDNFVAALTQVLGEIDSALDSHTKDNIKIHNESKQRLDHLMQRATECMNRMSLLKTSTLEGINSTAEQNCAQFRETLKIKMENTQNILDGFASCIVESLQRAGHIDLTSNFMEYFQNWHRNFATDVESFRNTHAAFETSVRNAAGDLLSAARRHRDDTQTTWERLNDDINNRIAALLEARDSTKQFLDEKESEMESERSKFESEFAKWAEEKRQRLEEKIKQQWTTGRISLEERMRKKLEDVERQKMLFEKLIAYNIDWLNEKLKTNQREIEKAEENMRVYENGLETSLSDLKRFVDECDRGYALISSNVEHLTTDSANVLEVVKLALLDDLRCTRAVFQGKSTDLIRDEQQSMAKLAEDSERTLQSVVQTCRGAMDDFVGEINSFGTSTLEDLSALSASTAHLTASCQDYQSRQSLSLAATVGHMERLDGNLRAEVARLEDMERRCLNQDYMVYSPSGNTPVRKDYRYPRTLAATSPDERILARFKAMRQNSNEDDCILIENEFEGRSDTDSSASDDSAFTAPSPPSSGNHSSISIPPIAKCTSETDIFIRRRQQEQQGKENAIQPMSRSGSFKKPSKLPAPTSQKKPLHERNSDQH